MKTNKKALLTVLCALLLVVASVMGTMAYLTATAEVKNTFTVGKVEITMDEAKVNEYGKLVDVNGDEYDPEDEVALAKRVIANEYKLMPGHTYVKDPTVHFAAKSEASYLFVKVEISDRVAALMEENHIQNQITSAPNSWTALPGVDGVYYKDVPANTGDVAVDYKVFDSFTLLNTADASKVTATDAITVTAYAIQKDGMTDAADAYAKVVAAYTPAAPEGGEG